MGNKVYYECETNEMETMHEENATSQRRVINCKKKEEVDMLFSYTNIHTIIGAYHT